MVSCKERDPWRTMGVLALGRMSLTEEGLRLWLRTKNGVFLAGWSPVDVIAAGRIEDVEGALLAIADGVFI